jgi:hypothetical protein
MAELDQDREAGKIELFPRYQVQIIEAGSWLDARRFPRRNGCPEQARCDREADEARLLIGTTAGLPTRFELN